MQKKEHGIKQRELSQRRGEGKNKKIKKYIVAHEREGVRRLKIPCSSDLMTILLLREARFSTVQLGFDDKFLLFREPGYNQKRERERERERESTKLGTY